MSPHPGEGGGRGEGEALPYDKEGLGWLGTLTIRKGWDGWEPLRQGRVGMVGKSYDKEGLDWLGTFR